jgi:hypothetical protein
VCDFENYGQLTQVILQRDLLEGQQHVRYVFESMLIRIYFLLSSIVIWKFYHRNTFSLEPPILLCCEIDGSTLYSTLNQSANYALAFLVANYILSALKLFRRLLRRRAASARSRHHDRVAAHWVAAQALGEQPGRQRTAEQVALQKVASGPAQP